MADPWRLGAAALCCAGVMAAGAGCAPRPSLPQGDSVRELSTRASLHGAGLTLHLADASKGTRPLVVYGSGDGGWFGAAVGMFNTIAEAGYPTAGFSSRALLKIEQGGHTPLSGEHIAESYHVILDAARQALGLPPDCPAVLTGWSRGAALAVLAASEPGIDRTVAGVVAIGLPRAERLEVEPGSDGDPGSLPAVTAAGAQSPSHELLMYPLLTRLAPRRSAIVQASGDGYLPAVQARTLFGTDSDVKRFFEVPATNHRFSGGSTALRQALIDALAWAGAARS